MLKLKETLIHSACRINQQGTPPFMSPLGWKNMVFPLIAAATKLANCQLSKEPLLNQRFLNFRLLAVLLVIVWASACTTTTTSTKVASQMTSAPIAVAVDLSKIPDPWKGPAGQLAKRGFNQKQLEALFQSSNLKYSSAPMSMKLKELYPIYFRSEQTKAIQQNLYQLGYDLRLDGQNGSETKSVIKKFQADRKLKETGLADKTTLAETQKAMQGKSLRPLSSYQAPPPPKPNQVTTYRTFTKDSALAKIKAYYNADKAEFQRMASRYNVPGEVVAAIMWVETGYGQYFGKQKAASMLASMAAVAADYSLVKDSVQTLPQDAESTAFLKETSVKRGAWALDELAALLKYSIENNHDATTFPGSIYGAIGWGQFMPSNVSKFGVDGNGDGRVDLFNKVDAIHSIGNYLKGHGWQGQKMTSMPLANRRDVIMKYNRSGIYVNTVLRVADYLAKQ